MSSRNKYYVYGAVLGIAVIVLVADRAMRQAPAPAEASDSAAATPQRPTPARTTSPPSSAAPMAEKASAHVDGSIKSQWLRDLPEVPEVRDLFAMARSKPPETDEQASGQEGRENDPDPSVSFADAHRLHATFQDGRVSYAVIDGRMIQVGQSIDGFRLESVSAYQATFCAGKHKAILSLSSSNSTPDPAEEPQ